MGLGGDGGLWTSCGAADLSFDSSVLQREILPGLAPDQVLSPDWARQFINKLKLNQDNLIEATRTSLTQLVEDYQTADTYLSASFTEEIGVLTDAVSAQASRITTLETQVQTPTTGLLARVTVTESAITTLDSSVATLSTTVSSHTTSISTINSNITTIQGDVTTLFSTTSTLTGNVSTLTTTVSSHTTSISSINGSITTLSASVTTNATAITTVDGKLTASYGLTVDGGGRIVSMKLLSNGVTSSVKFLASTFTIYDGASDVPMFEVSGGAAYVSGDRVRTASMLDNAVSTTSAVFSASGATTSITVTTSGGDLVISASFQSELGADGGPSDYAEHEAEIIRDSTPIYQSYGPINQAGAGVGALGYSIASWAATAVDTPAAGTYTYTVSAPYTNSNGNLSQMRNIAIVVTELKK